jgi:hypothetical protein
MTEYLMIFPEREIADEIAEDLLEEDDFTEVRVVSEALAGEEDDEDHDWGVYVRQATIDDAASAVAQALAERFEKLAEEHGGWLDDNPAQQPTR